MVSGRLWFRVSRRLLTPVLNDKGRCHSQRASENRRWNLRLYGRRCVDRSLPAGTRLRARYRKVNVTHSVPWLLR